MHPQQMELAGQSALYGGAAGAFTFWGLGMSEWAALIAALVAVGGFCLNVWTTLAKRKEAKELHAARLDAIRAGKSVDAE